MNEYRDGGSRRGSGPRMRKAHAYCSSRSQKLVLVSGLMFLQPNHSPDSTTTVAYVSLESSSKAGDIVLFEQ
jgi:hypothetical protein